MNSNFGRILVICRSLLVELICCESDCRPTRLSAGGGGGEAGGAGAGDGGGRAAEARGEEDFLLDKQINADLC